MRLLRSASLSAFALVALVGSTASNAAAEPFELPPLPQISQLPQIPTAWSSVPWLASLPSVAFPVPPSPMPTPRAACTASPDAKGVVARSITVGGKTTTYSTYAPPSYDPSAPTTLVLAFHGAGMTKEEFVETLQDAAKTRGFLLVVPEGSVPMNGGFTWSVADAQSVTPILNDVEACYSVNPKRRIVEGYSSGGAIAYRVGLGDAAKFAGISIDAGSLNSAEAMAGKTLVPGAAWHIPVSIVHGTADDKIPIASSRNARARLVAAGHPTFMHEFDGGHAFDPALFLTSYDDLSTSYAP